MKLTPGTITVFVVFSGVSVATRAPTVVLSENFNAQPPALAPPGSNVL